MSLFNPALSQTSAIWIVLRTALIAGTLDISDSLIFNAFGRVTPYMVFQYIASGLIGMRSFHLGAASVALGILLHCAIALIWTAVFFAAHQRLKILRVDPILCGLLYGALVYLFTNWIVLPLSGVPHPHNAMTIASRINGVLAVLIFIGLTSSLLLHRASRVQ